MTKESDLKKWLSEKGGIVTRPTHIPLGEPPEAIIPLEDIKKSRLLIAFDRAIESIRKEDIIIYHTRKLPSLQEGIVSKEIAERISRDDGHTLPFESREQWFYEMEQTPVVGTRITLNREDVDNWRQTIPENQFKKRVCYNPNCRKSIGFYDYKATNKKIPVDQLEKIWESPHVELLCCTCYRKEVIKNDLMKKQERILNKCKRILDKFGFGDEYSLKFREL